MLSVVLYSAIAIVAVGGVGSEALSQTGSPLGRAASEFTFPGVVFFIGIGATAAMLGILLSQLLGISQMMFAMARKNDLPSMLGNIHPKYNVPHIGIFFSGALSYY